MKEGNHIPFKAGIMIPTSLMGKLRPKEVKKLKHGSWRAGEQEEAEMDLQAGEDESGPVDMTRDQLEPKGHLASG